MNGRALLPGRRIGPMPVIVAVMLFLATLAAAAALALSSVADRLEGGDRLTVQVMAADPSERDAQAQRLLTLFERDMRVTWVRLVDQEEMQDLLRPWLGRGAAEDLPLPTLIEAELTAGLDTAELQAAVTKVAPSALVNAQADWLAPVRRLVLLLRWLATGLVLLSGLATALTVALTARASLGAHTDTVGLLRLMGATDRQLVRLFERRAALETLVGGLTGWIAAFIVLLLVSRRLDVLSETPLGAPDISLARLLLLLLPPLAATLLAMLVARVTLLRALNQTK